jgi:hypothetical protein
LYDPDMSYKHSGLGQGKYIPGQVNFLMAGRGGREPGWQRAYESYGRYYGLLGDGLGKGGGGQHGGKHGGGGHHGGHGGHRHGGRGRGFRGGWGGPWGWWGGGPWNGYYYDDYYPTATVPYQVVCGSMVQPVSGFQEAIQVARAMGAPPTNPCRIMTPAGALVATVSSAGVRYAPSVAGLGVAPSPGGIRNLARVIFQVIPSGGATIPILTRGIRNAVRYGKSLARSGPVQLVAMKDSHGRMLSPPVVVATVDAGARVSYAPLSGVGEYFEQPVAGLGVMPTFSVRNLNRVIFTVTGAGSPIPVITRGITRAVRYGKSMSRAGVATIMAVKDANGRALTPPVSIATVTGGRVAYGSLHGLGDSTLTDYACNTAVAVQDWKTRLDDALSSGGQAALIGGGVAGLIGALIGRPIIGAAIGAAAGWGAHAVWTAPLASTITS